MPVVTWSAELKPFRPWANVALNSPALDSNQTAHPVICFFTFSGYSQVDPVVQNLSANAGGTRDMGLISGSGTSPIVGNGNPLQYSYLENSMDRGGWQASVHGATESQTQMSS